MKPSSVRELQAETGFCKSWLQIVILRLMRDGLIEHRVAVNAELRRTEFYALTSAGLARLQA